ncbi:[histone H3]-lysine(4) N-trimethyltransferase [Trifolium repens]|nr:[histone H3]-lysine(4) N-trimethyltransferase [Trifolium repens]
MSLCNGHSEQELGIPLMANGGSSILARPKIKHRAVSAVRDYPEECGLFGSADGTSVEDKSEECLGGDAVSPNHEDDFQHSEVDKNLFDTETLEQTRDCSLKKEDLVVLSDQVEEDTLANDEAAKVALVGMETSDMEFATEVKKEDHMVSSHQEDGDTFANNEPAKVASVDMENGDMEFATEVKKEDQVSSHQVDQPTLDNVEQENVALADMETLDAEFATESCSQKKENPTDMSTFATDEPAKLAVVGTETLDTEFATEDSVKQDFCNISSPFGEVAMYDDAKSLTSNIDIGGSGARMEETVTKKYPPRKKVAAIRDFPRLCGRNAPLLTKDECLKELSSLNKRTVGQTDVKEADNNKRKLANIVQADSEGNATQRVKKMDVVEPSSEMGLALDNTKEMNTQLSEKYNLHQVNINPKAVVKEENTNTVQVEGTSGRKIVLGLMSKSECPWRSDIISPKFKPATIGGTDERKGKKVDFYAQLDRSKTAVKTKHVPNHSEHVQLKKKKANSNSDDMGELVRWENNSLDPNNNSKNFKSVPKSHGVNVPPLGRSNFSGRENDSMARNKVRNALRLFQAVSRKLLQEAEAKAKSNEKERRRFDLQAAKILKEKGNYVNEGEKIMGAVPGVEVGDEFQYRIELNIIGLHRQIQGGIDYMKHKNKMLATSIVASGGYSDELDNTDVLIYTGQGGNVMSSDKDPEDQKLERGNLALKNSSEEKNPVRVIRGSESMDGKSRIYVYDGLYLVESCWQEMGTHGKLVYKFRLQRIPGQPELALKEVKKSKKFKIREGQCVKDISYGKERIPICAVNTIDDEKPPTFKYITKMIYPDCCNLVPPEGCGCTNGCSDHAKCSCVLKNGGEIPFNHNGAIVEAKSLVYECGPKCKCPPTCHNRVSQLGINIQLEIFKTNSMGWGVRSLNSIPSGSFICEYIGEVLEDKEAEQRTGNDEYLFDIGNNKTNNTLWDGLSTLIPDSHSSSCEVVNDVGFTIDAAQFGNVGRFINHSCSPNLYAQNVLFDHNDIRIPHVMLFAAENIPPLQELSYDYNYMIDQVRDSDGNIKKKYCYCGSVECTGFLPRR